MIDRFGIGHDVSCFHAFVAGPEAGQTNQLEQAGVQLPCISFCRKSLRVDVDQRGVTRTPRAINCTTDATSRDAVRRPVQEPRRELRERSEITADQRS